MQSWPLTAPAKHSTRQIEAVLDRIEVLYRLGFDRQLMDVPDVILRLDRLVNASAVSGARYPAETQLEIDTQATLKFRAR
jgi:hypothetical protein